MESQVKGLSLRNYLIVLGSLRGEDVAARAMAMLPDELRLALQGGAIVPMGWYPVAWNRELHDAGRRATGEPRLARIMGNEMTKRDLVGVYRVFMRIASPQFVLAASGRIFSRYFRPGIMEVSERRRGFVLVNFKDCHGFDENMWHDVLGACEATIELAGAKSLRIHVEAGGKDGDTTMIITGWWTDEKESTPEAQ